MKHGQNVILAIDEGTSGTRSAVVSADGLVRFLEYHPLRVESLQHGVTEQNADDILKATLEVCRKTIAQAQQDNLHIVALSIATQRSTSVLWDSKTGKSLVPAMVWQDARYADILHTLVDEWDSRLLQHTGRPVGIRSPYLWAAKHIQETPVVAEAFKANRLKFGTIDSWLLWNLSQEGHCITTPTNATSAGAYSLREHRYYTPWLEALSFPLSLLPELKDDLDDLGTTRQDLLGISVPILACMGDQFAGAVGLGCIQHGQSICMHGTGSFIDQIVSETVPSFDHQLESTLAMVARRQQSQSHYSVETFVPTTGSALNWVCEKLHWFDSPEQISELAMQAQDAGGVSFIPALTGLRVPSLQPQARASLNGISISTTRPQIAYAILEGIANSVAGCLRANQSATGLTAQQLVVGGGMSNSDALLQIQADISGIPVLRMSETARASLRGAAFLAGSNGLLWDSLESACETLTVAKRFIPSINEAERNQRLLLWNSRLQLEIDYTAIKAIAC
ncbi:glycerol kinase [Providencia stuartii]|uniref:ATP:glycerol 3-phosphotransferase n=1 Tax=Providencia stuartii TaxID=588 RepID=A0A1S1HVM2_PROST|nr:glycerol kinase [Providencia stuartii]